MSVLENYFYDKESLSPNSVESFYVSPFFLNNWFIIPYINLGVWKNSISPGSNMVFIDYSYIICFGLSHLSYDENIIIGEKFKETDLVFGGVDLLNPKIGGEFWVEASEAYLVTFAFSRLSAQFWQPIPHGYHQVTNMDRAFLERFIKNEFLPKRVLGS